MSNLIETSTFDSDIYLIETTDLVLGGGGVDDIANKQAQALANRTTFLKDNLYRLKSVEDISSTVTLTNDDSHILHSLSAPGNITVTLPDVTTVTPGTYFPFSSIMPFAKCATIACNGSQKVHYANADERAQLYMYNSERLVLVAATDHWEIESCYGHFDSVGESFGARKQKGNTVILNGSLVSRADYARLYNEFVALLTSGQEVVTDAVWLAGVPGNINAYRGCFSYGNGSTTFRFPDERGLFDRYLDLSRGLDLGRIHNYAGGMENDELKEHDHLMFNGQDGGSPYVSQGHSTGGNLGYGMNGSNTSPTWGKTSLSGGAETRPKNIGKIPLIRF